MTAQMVIINAHPCLPGGPSLPLWTDVLSYCQRFDRSISAATDQWRFQLSKPRHMLYISIPTLPGADLPLELELQLKWQLLQSPIPQILTWGVISPQ